ncbi:hypothetical protein F4823DRAFT_65340 [Ustulina deusta]|nr:hypothetical protein F4823DRAFT_65340 [Ustulina deusta]
MDMSYDVYSCVFCGWLISYDSFTVSWTKQFRGLYDGPAGIVLTGVGLYDTPWGARFIAPVDSKARWDDEGYNHPMDDRFGAMTQPEYNGRHGFVFHDACWCLLEKALLNRAVPVSLERLFQVLSSLSFSIPDMRINWGHDFGGAVVVPEFFYDTEVGGPDDQRSVEPYITYGANPCDAAEVDQILAETPQSPPRVVVTIPGVGTVGNGLLDTLPLELRIAIAVQLSTSDALNARLASRAFLPVFYDQQFWASRFKYASDRAWLFEAWERRQTTDWRWLYRRTHVTRIGPALRNRRRIWNLFGTVIDTVALRRQDSNMPTSHSPKPDSAHPVEVVGVLWKEWEGLRSQPYSFVKGCRQLHKHYVTIPNNLSRFSVSYIQTPGAGYISGIKFTTTTGNIVQLGYWGTTEYSIHVTNIRGFVLAVGSRGIRAIKCLTASDTTSCWLGCPDDSAKTRRLALFDTPLDSLEVGFDGFKMVRLATTMPLSLFPEKDTLRSLGLWYPNIPGPTLSLNESSFWPRSNHLHGYQPLVWTTFGGPGGKYLNHLIRISVTLGGGLRGIDFTYNTDVPVEYRSLGHCPPKEDAKVVDFAIDGPGGEIINAVELDYSKLESWGRKINWSLSSCKASRVESFSSKVYSSADPTCRCSPIAQDHAYSLTNLTGGAGSPQELSR